MRISQPKANEPIRIVETQRGVRYRVVIDISPTRTRRQVTRTFDSLKQARDFVSITRAGLASGNYTAPSSETVEQLCLRWLDNLTNVREVRTVTVQGYRNVLAPVLRHIGHRQVQSVTVRDVDDLAAWLTREGGRRGQGLSPRSVRAALTALVKPSSRRKGMALSPAMS
jgi:hypothetical protein